MHQARRADANQRDVRSPKRRSRIGRRPQPALANHADDERPKARLDHGRPAVIDHRDLLRIDVDAAHAVPRARQARRRDTPDIAKAKHADFHDTLLEEDRISGWMTLPLAALCDPGSQSWIDGTEDGLHKLLATPGGPRSQLGARRLQRQRPHERRTMAGTNRVPAD